MKFSTLVSFFKRLEETTSQTRMTEILSELFSEASEDDVDIVCYFVLGKIAPGYRDINLGLGDKMVTSALALAAEKSEEEIESRVQEEGSLSSLAAKLTIPWKDEYAGILPDANGLSVRDVHDGLMQIARVSGEGSQKEKKVILGALMEKAEEKERYYIIRLATGAMRLGAGDRTLLDGMSLAVSGSREKRPV
ncbi:MAG: hypothetical protein RQ758_07045, partial [Methanomicrobiaceae archaeon]|nr:hypothetical protein [Methanomicrobiaceae archaeon]